MPLYETAPGVEEYVGSGVSHESQEDVAQAAHRREIAAATVKEAVQSGSLDTLQDAIVRETIGFLAEPYFSDFALMGVQDISGRPTYGYGYGATDLDPSTRMREVTFARRLVNFAPPAKQAVRLHRCYVIGAGIPKPVALDQDVQRVIDEFWGDNDNWEITTHIGQAETDARQIVDGELFVSLFTSREDGHVKVRTVDVLDVDEIICHPEDRRRPLYYRVRQHHEEYDFQGGRAMPSVGAADYVYYPSWSNTDPLRDPYRGKAKPRAPDHACMAHWPLNRMGLRGVPDFCAGGVWIAQHKKFMENRAILQEALSKIALVKTVKGGPGPVTASANLERSSLSQSLSTWERNPAPATGATYVKNQGVDLEQLRVDTGAGNAVQDGEMLSQMIGTSFGLPTHYIMMSTEASRLATAVAMELPVLKMYEDAQRRWLDMLRSIIDYVLLQAAKYGSLYVPVIRKHGREMIDWDNAPPPPEEIANPDEDAAEQQTAQAQQMQQQPAPPMPPGPMPPPANGAAMPPPQQFPVREQGGMGIDPLQVTAQVEHIRQRESTAKRENKERGNYKIDLPPILSREVGSEIQAVVQAVQAGLITPEQGAYITMNALQMDDVSDSMLQWREYLATHSRHIQDQSEQTAQQMQQQQQMQHEATMAKTAGPDGGVSGVNSSGSPMASSPPPSAQPPTTTAGASVPSGGMSGNPSPGPNG